MKWNSSRVNRLRFSSILFLCLLISFGCRSADRSVSGESTITIISPLEQATATEKSPKAETETPSSTIPSLVPSPETLRKVAFIDESTTLVRFSNDGSCLAITPDNNLVLVMNPLSGEVIQQLDIPRAGVNGTNAIAFSHDDRYIATGGLEERVDVFNLEAGTLVASLDTNEVFLSSVMISDLLFDPINDSIIVASNWDLGGIAVWDYLEASSSLLFTKPVNSMALDPSSNSVGLATWPTGITLETDASVVLLDIQSGTFQEVSIEGVIGADIQIDSSQADLYAVVDGGLFVADMETGDVFLKDYGLKGIIVLMDVSLSGVLALLSSEDFDHPEDTVFGRFNKPDARYLISLIDTTREEVIASIELVGVTDIDFSPDGSLLAVSVMNEGVSIWEIQYSNIDD